MNGEDDVMIVAELVVEIMRVEMPLWALMPYASSILTYKPEYIVIRKNPFKQQVRVSSIKGKTVSNPH